MVEIPDEFARAENRFLTLRECRYRVRRLKEAQDAVLEWLPILARVDHPLGPLNHEDGR